MNICYKVESTPKNNLNMQKATKKKTPTKKKAVPQEKPKEYTTPSFGIRYF